MKFRKLILIIISGLFLINSFLILSQTVVALTNNWIADGVPISIATDTQNSPDIAIDGAGGAIITWSDRRSGIDYDIYVQRIDSSGAILWNKDGLGLTSGNDDQNYPSIYSDGNGGAIVVWEDYRSGTEWDIYAQHIDSAGNVLWSPNGIIISNDIGNQHEPRIIDVGSGDFIISWYDANIYAQKIDINGNRLWPGNGTVVSSAVNAQNLPRLVDDGAGGAIIAWSDLRGGVDTDIYAQHINSTGNPQWVVNGTPICTETNSQTWLEISTDGLGGAIIAWQDLRSGTDEDIYSQRVNSSGITQWVANGTAISTEINDQFYLDIVSDGVGGVYITWNDARGGSKIYAQHIDISGNVLWELNGTLVSSIAYSQNGVRVIEDGLGGAIFIYSDDRITTDYDIYAQRLNSLGASQWDADGVGLCKYNERQMTIEVTSDGSGGAIAVWRDRRNELGGDIYAQHISSNGVVDSGSSNNGNSDIPPENSILFGNITIVIITFSIIALILNVKYKLKQNLNRPNNTTRM